MWRLDRDYQLRLLLVCNHSAHVTGGSFRKWNQLPARTHMFEAYGYVLCYGQCFREGGPLNEQKTKIIPFLKWAGGKRWLVEKHPDLLKVDYVRYIEPFVGSGAVFFSLAPPTAIISDRNARLIETYEILKTNWGEVQDRLKIHQRKHSKEYYYQVRSMACRTPVNRAAQFIYLNRTCWNGLYRVNKRGEFNVPIGTKNTVVLESDDFEKISSALKDVEICSTDFEVVINRASSGDFVFVDPPYTVKHNLNGFVKYNESIFSWDDQVRLRDAVVRASNRGAKILVTNACHDSVRRLYEDHGVIKKVTRSSVIAGTASARGEYEEIIIKCF